uniref:Uncharacterized protein n=1 Tax=Eutreptiella gymnastica TaxID=73025 RepID=A0A7S4CAT8_9EUGL
MKIADATKRAVRRMSGAGEPGAEDGEKEPGLARRMARRMSNKSTEDVSPARADSPSPSPQQDAGCGKRRDSEAKGEPSLSPARADSPASSSPSPDAGRRRGSGATYLTPPRRGSATSPSSSPRPDPNPGRRRGSEAKRDAERAATYNPTDADFATMGQYLKERPDKREHLKNSVIEFYADPDGFTSLRSDLVDFTDDPMLPQIFIHLSKSSQLSFLVYDERFMAVFGL